MRHRHRSLPTRENAHGLGSISNVVERLRLFRFARFSVDGPVLHFRQVSSTAQLSTSDHGLVGLYCVFVASGLMIARLDLPHWLTMIETDPVMYIGPFRSAAPISGIRRIKRFDYKRDVLAGSERRLELACKKFKGKVARPADEETFIVACRCSPLRPRGTATRRPIPARRSVPAERTARRRRRRDCRHSHLRFTPRRRS